MYSAEDLFTEDADDDLERIVEGDGDDQYGDNDTAGAIAEGAGGEDDDNQATDADGNAGQAKTKRVVRNPQPKLNADTLRSARGLLCLENLFARVQYKGRGNEEHDLNMVLKTYEYWCHRMFPKLPFDDCVAKLEKLGTKKPVQAYLKRIRFDLLTDSDEIPQAVPDEPLEDDGDNEADPFDTLRPGSEANPPQSLQAEQQWTDEQLRRLEENRLHAQRIKMNKLKKIQEKAASVMERSDAASANQNQSPSSQRMDEFPDEIDEVTVSNINQQTSRDPTSMEVEEGLRAGLEPNSENEQWSKEQLERLEENRQRAAKIRLERQRKLRGIAMEENHDDQTSNVENIEKISDTVMTGTLWPSMSPTFAQEHDVKRNSLNRKEDNIDAPSSEDMFANDHDQNVAEESVTLVDEMNPLNRKEHNIDAPSSEDMFANDHDQSVAEDGVTLVDEMETEPILSPTNQETLSPNLCDADVATNDVMEVERNEASLDQTEIAKYNR